MNFNVKVMKNGEKSYQALLVLLKITDFNAIVTESQTNQMLLLIF